MSTEDFIERVRSFEVIYDKKNINYSNTKEREKIWGQLNKEFKFDAKKKWIALRDKYVREKKKLMKQHGSGAEFTSQSNFYSQMSFIDDHIKPRNIENCDPIIKDNSDEDIKAFYNDFCMEITVPNNNTNNIHTENSNSSCDVLQQTKPKIQEVTNSIQQDFLETLKILKDKIQNFKEQEESDEDSIFLQLVAIKMKKMSSADKSNFQLEILKRADDIILKTNNIG